MRRLVALIALSVLVSAPDAAAKGTAQICGGDRCVTVSDLGHVGPLRSTFGPASEPSPAPFYVVRFCSRSDCRGRIDWSYVYVPSANAMLANHIGSGDVHWMDASLLSAPVASLTKDLEPYGPSPTWKPNAFGGPTRHKAPEAHSMARLALAKPSLAVGLAVVLWRLLAR